MEHLAVRQVLWKTHQPPRSFAAHIVLRTQMFSALILISTNIATPPEAVVRTLAALVPAAIEGVVRDVMMCGPSSTPDLARICDHAGCDFIVGEPGAPLGDALVRLKEQRVFVLRAGRVPEHGYLGEIADFVAYGGEGSALMRDAPHNFMTRILPALAPVSAFIAPREVLATARVDDVDALARSLKSPRALKSRMMRG